MKIVFARERINRNFKSRARLQGSVSRISFAENDLVLLRVPKLSNAFRKFTNEVFSPLLWFLQNCKRFS